MANYIDGFVFPINRVYVNEYKKEAEKVAKIWKEYGAISYFEYAGDDMMMEGALSFNDVLQAKENELIIFGWMVFPSKKIRDEAFKKVVADQRMNVIIDKLIHPDRMIFDSKKMVYGGFKPFLEI